MTKKLSARLAAPLLGLLLSCSGSGGGGGAPSSTSSDPNSGGDLTVFLSSDDAFSQIAPNLVGTRRDPFFLGNSFFNTTWVTAPSSTAARDGLGPLFVASSCSACHTRDGRGRPPLAGEQALSLLFRLSIPNPMGGDPLPEPTYGSQLQNRAGQNVPVEALVSIQLTDLPGQFHDGTPYTLQKPDTIFSQPGYGAFAVNLQVSPRVAQPVFGLGLLASIPDSQLRSWEDAQDLDGDGISGRANEVFSLRQQAQVIGRFGWKAGQPDLRQQSAAAFNEDIGLTTSLFPNENISPLQTAAQGQPSGGQPEIEDSILDPVDFYLHTLAVPGRRRPNDPQVQAGEQLFARARCDACHISSVTTGMNPDFPELSFQRIHPYSDLLLHDMGVELADNRPEGLATGQEWRTAPLWGIGLTEAVNGHSRFLHDGRARDLSEAILWHGGEAAAARDQYRAMSQAEREALLAFLRDL